MTLDAYRPELWRDFFVMAGGAAAALTGLVFVALSLHVDVIARDATHRFRAIGSLVGFSAAFMTCALALMGGQGPLWIGIEWLITAGSAAFVYICGYVQAVRRGGSRAGLSSLRLAAGTVLYVAEIVGAVVLLLGNLAGLYVAAVAMVALLAWGISGAWLLVLGAQHGKPRSSG